MRKMIRKGMIYLPMMGMAALLMAGCKGNTAQQTDGAALPEVKVETVHSKAVEQVQEYMATVNPYSKNSIASFQATMHIEKIRVEVGDMVQQGQLLVEMEATNYLQTKLQLENLKTDYSRMLAMYESGGISKQQLDQLKTQVDVTQEVLDNLEKSTYLKSPVNGIVTQRFFDNGDMSGGQPILQVQQFNALKISINIQEQYFPIVKTKMPAAVTVESRAGEVFEGKVSLVHPTVDPVTHTFTTELEVNNSALKIRPGMFARVLFNFGTIEHVVVSDKAIVKQTGTNDRYVYVLNNDNTVSYKKVELGQRMGEYYELLSGVNDGEQVVTAGMSRLVDGTAVTVISE